MMKFLTTSIVAASLALVSCQPKEEKTKAQTPEPESPAQGLVVNAAQPSPYFEEVLSHLDIGGKALHFEDHEGRREFWVGLIDLILKANPGGEFGPLAGMDAATLVDQSGFCNVAASGRSISKDGDLWLLRQYSHYPDGLSSVAELWGKPHALEMGGKLPAATDIALELQLNGSSLPASMRDSAKLMGTSDEVEASLKKMLPIGMTLAAVLEQSEARLLIGIELEKSDIKDMPVVPKAWVMKITAKKALVTACKPLLDQALGEASEIAGHQGWKLPVPPMPGLLESAPLLLLDGDESLMIVSSAEYLTTLDGDGPKLAGDATYQNATDHFPKTANLQAYLSPMVGTAAREWVKMAAAKQEEAKVLLEMVDKITPDKPWSACVACSDKGVDTLMEMPFAIDANTATTMTLLGATSTAFVGARAWKKGSDRAGCILNIRNVQQAVRGHQNMQNLKIGDPIDWDAIFGDDGYLKEPKCPMGGTYTFARSYPENGTLACTCSKAGTEEGHEPTNHDDW